VNEETFELQLRWNNRNSSFYITLTNISRDIVIVTGIKLLFGNDVLFPRRYHKYGLRGQLFLYDTGRTQTRPDWKNISSAKLEYLDVSVR